MNKVAAVRGTRSLHDRAMHARGVVAILTKPFTRAHVAMHTRWDASCIAWLASLRWFFERSDRSVQTRKPCDYRTLSRDNRAFYTPPALRLVHR
jgi:hypothetical protein